MLDRAPAFPTFAFVLALALFAAALGQAGEAEDQRPASRYGELWKVPLYLSVGALRDAVDVPCKGVSSVPGVNRVLFAPLLLVNTATSVVSWSLTDEGIEGGVEAWVRCMDLERKRRARRRAPAAIVRRPWWACYLPNLSSGARILTNTPRPDFTRERDAPLPKADRAPAGP